MAENPSFAGRIGGVQKYTVNRDDPDQASLLERAPDAAPNLTLRESFRFHQFTQPLLWKAAAIEGVATMLLVYITTFLGSSVNEEFPSSLPAPNSFSQAVPGNALLAYIVTVALFTLLILTVAPISGGHLNPMITFATFLTRLTTFPRAVLYIAFQLAGSSLAGLMLRASVNTRDFKVAGCYLFENEYSTATSALAIEFMSCLLLLFLAFGLGLDPRQAELFNPVFATFLVAVAVPSVTFATSFTKPSYGGVGLNPGRCFGVYVGSRFDSWSWVTWVGPILASVLHAIVYALVPPGITRNLNPKYDKDEEASSQMGVLESRAPRDGNEVKA